MSAYFHNIKAGRLSPEVSFAEALERRPGLRDFGRYATQLEAWLAHYPIERFLVLVYEEEIAPDDAKPSALWRTFEHLGVDASFEPADTSVQRNVRLSHFEMRLRHATPEQRQVLDAVPMDEREDPRWAITIPDEDLRALAAEYCPEVERLEELLSRPMPWDLAR